MWVQQQDRVVLEPRAQLVEIRRWKKNDWPKTTLANQQRALSENDTPPNG